MGFPARDDFGRHMAFMHGFVRQHGLAHDIAYGMDVRHIRAHLAVDLNETAFSHGYAGLISTNALAIWCAPDRLQHQVVALWLGGSALAFERDPDAVLAGFSRHR